MSGYVGGRFDRTLVLLMDAVYAFPALLLSIIVAFILKEKLDPGLPSAAVAVGVVYIPQYYRVIRNHTLSVKQEPFVEAARSLGAQAPHGHRALRVLQRGAERAGHLHPQRGRRGADPRRSRVPRLRRRVPAGRVGPRREPRA